MVYKSDRPIKIVFATHAAAGQLNLQLAVLRSLLEGPASVAEVELHLISFQRARPRCPPKVKIHLLPQRSLEEALKVGPWEVYLGRIAHKPSFFGVLRRAVDLPWIFSPHSAAEYLEIARGIEGILEDVQPDLVVVHGLFPQAKDAAKRLGCNVVILSPNAWQDNAAPHLPRSSDERKKSKPLR